MEAGTRADAWIGRVAGCAMIALGGVACTSEAATTAPTDGSPGPSSSSPLPPPDPPPCFGAGTPIATPRGEIAIQRLRAGEAVLAYDEATFAVVVDTVTQVMVHPNRATGALRVSDGRTLRVTPEHPIYVPDQQRYAPAREVSVDARLLSLRNPNEVTSAVSLGFTQASSFGVETVYDLTVARHHNYFAAAILVHNKQPCTPCTCGSCRDVAVECQPVAVQMTPVDVGDSGSDAGVACAWKLPAPEPGVVLDLGKLNVRITTADGVDDLLYTEIANCYEFGWRLDDPDKPTAIVACPALCTRLHATTPIKVEALLGCARRVPR